MTVEFGQVTKVVVPKNRDTGKPRGFAFVDMATHEDMQAAIDGVDGRLLRGRVLRASPTMSKDQQVKKRNQSSAMAKVHVGNISYETTQEELVEHFQQFGMVFEVYLPRNDNGRSRGFAFLSVKKDELDSIIENSNPKIFQSVQTQSNKIIFENKDYKNPYRVTYEFLTESSYRRTIEGRENDSLVTYVFDFKKSK